MSLTLKIPNQSGEMLGILAEGNLQAENTIIFVHGFGTDKHETTGLFDKIAASLWEKNRTIRFDFSGYGKSQGRSEEVSFAKHAEDLGIVLAYIANSSTKNIDLIAMSMGCYITALQSPNNINRSIFIIIPDQQSQTLKNAIIKRIQAAGGKVNEQGVTRYPRSTGEVQAIGPSFWQGIDHIKPLIAVKEYSLKTRLYLIHPSNDEVVLKKNVQNYQSINTLDYKEIPGNHSFSNSSDRQNLIEIINQYLIN